jgi:hypothetical protein
MPTNHNLPGGPGHPGPPHYRSGLRLDRIAGTLIGG